MNTTHQFYQNLMDTNPGLLDQLEQLAHQSKPEEARVCLQPHLPDEVRETIDYLRLHALLCKDFSGADLTNEDFRGMVLTGFHFTRARLRHARLVEANLQGADLADADLSEADLTACNLTSAHLERANCWGAVANRAILEAACLEASNWERTDLLGANLTDASAWRASFAYACLTHADMRGTQLYEANLMGADFRWSDLSKSQLEGADLQGCICFGESFDGDWQIDSRTKISSNNHTLIGQVLLSRAQTMAQQQFAFFVQHRMDLCWPAFLQLLLQEQPELIAWAKEALSSIESLRSHVEYTEQRLGEFQKALQERRLARLDDIRSFNPQVGELLRAEAERQAFLSTRELVGYLRGVLAGARRLPELSLGDEQCQMLDQQLLQMLDK